MQDSPTWDCPLCSRIFPIMGVEEHIRFFHIGGSVHNDWSCSECEYRSPEFGELAAHCFAVGHDASRAHHSEDLDLRLLDVLVSIQENQPEIILEAESEEEEEEAPQRRESTANRLLASKGPAPKKLQPEPVPAMSAKAEEGDECHDDD